VLSGIMDQVNPRSFNGNNIFQPVLVDSPMGDQPMHLHNTPLMVGVGSGIPTLVFFMWIFIRLGREFFVMNNRKN